MSLLRAGMLGERTRAESACGTLLQCRHQATFPGDRIFEEAERLARRLKKSRSELYREALAEYVARHDSEAVTEAMNRVAGQIEAAPEAAVAGASRRILER